MLKESYPNHPLSPYHSLSPAAVPKGTTVIMDNASFHPPKKLKNPCRRHGMGLLFLPAYSPDYNPIEKSRANMKRALIDIIPTCEDVPAAV
jgi:transposase